MVLWVSQSAVWQETTVPKGWEGARRLFHKSEDQPVIRIVYSIRFVRHDTIMKNAYLIILFVLFYALASCGDTTVNDDSLAQNTASPQTNESPTIPDYPSGIDSIEIQPFTDNQTYLTTGQYRFKLKIVQVNGNIAYQTTDFQSQDKALAGSILWSVEDTSLASIDNTGLLIPKLAGNTVIRAVLLGKIAEYDLSIHYDLQLSQLSFTEENRQIHSRRAHKLTLNYIFTDETTLIDKAPDEVTLPCQTKLMSSNETIAVVTQAGILVPLSNGVVTITASCGNKDASTEITVDAFALPVQNSDEHPPQTDNTPPPPVQPPANAPTESLLGIDITTPGDTALLGQGLYTYKCRLTFDTGIVSNVTGNYTTPNGTPGTLIWSSSDNNLASFNAANKLVPKKYGVVTIQATTKGQVASRDINLLMAPEQPLQSDDRYLGPADTLTMIYGPGAGFGGANYPQILYGTPKGLFSTSVLSFGFGGSLTIELNDYVVVDGPGADFTVFENPIVSGNFVFAERGRVSVSDDGVHFEEFPCDAFDPEHVFTGCAGVHPFNEGSSPYNPLVSGGDSYDLSDLDLPVVKWIRITDAQTCVAGDITYPLCGEGGKKGFDMDALAIINGRREPININY